MLLALFLAASPGATLASGHHFTCALGKGGTVSCWGANEAGQLGDGTREARSSPVRVLGLSGATDLACGVDHACAVNAAGEVLCWGNNGTGAAGEPIDVFVATPRKVAGLPRVARVFAGGSTTCAITTDERLRCWGRNLTGQLGFPHPADQPGQAAPVELPQLTAVRSVAIGDEHLCALTANGDVSCWGSNGNARSGGSGPIVAVPTKVASGAVAIAVTSTASFAVGKDGTLTWWGSWQRDRDFVNAPSPRAASDTDVQAVFGSRYAVYVRRGASDWSFPKSGVSPLLPAVDLSWAKELVAGDNHACGRAHDGGVRCWGWNREGVGTGSTAAVKVPTAVSLDAAEKQPVVRRPDAAESCTANPSGAPKPAEPPARPQCGNGTRDVIGQTGGQCAPCMPGRSCPCAPVVSVLEPCDGSDFGGATCASLGLGSGELECTARCTIDTAACTPASTLLPGAGVVAWPRVPTALRPNRGLALAARGAELGVVWGLADGCGQAVLGRFTSDLTFSSSSAPFGRPGVTRVQLAATPDGWLVALGDVSDTTSVFVTSADGKASAERAAFFGRPVFLEAAGPDGPWLLGLSSRRDHTWLGSFTTVLLDARGAVLAERLVFPSSAPTTEMVESMPPQADQAVATSVPGGFLVARSQLVPGSSPGGVVVARVSKTGVVESKTFVAPRGASPFWLPGKELRLGWLRAISQPGQPGLFVAESVRVDVQGKASGDVQPFAELGESEWVTTGAASLTSPALLVPRLDAFQSTYQSGVSTRLQLVESSKLRMTLVEGKGIGPSRLTTWGEHFVAGWLFQQDGAQRLGLAKVSPAASR